MLSAPDGAMPSAARKVLFFDRGPTRYVSP